MKQFQHQTAELKSFGSNSLAICVGGRIKILSSAQVNLDLLLSTRMNEKSKLEIAFWLGTHLYNPHTESCTQPDFSATLLPAANKGKHF